MELGTMILSLGEGFLVTLQIFFYTLLGALPLGVVVALGRMSKIKAVALVFRAFISIMRGTPLMLQLMFVYFAPYYILGIQLSLEWKMGATVVAFVLNYSAYFAEIYRSGIQSIPVGQYEAAQVLGYSRSQTFFRIVFPQVIKRIVPAMGNEIIVLVKDTSLAFTIGVMEMFTTARAIVSAESTLVAFAVAAVFYWLFTFFLEFVFSRIEKRLSYYHD